MTAEKCSAHRADPNATLIGCRCNDASQWADEWELVFAANMQNEAFREAFYKAEREYDEAHCPCGGARWTDDENWSPEFRGDRRKPGGPGRLPCGFCNHGGWHVPDPMGEQT